jgi:16S rRNA (guanine527-N7)-methyltransferase
LKNKLQSKRAECPPSSPRPRQISGPDDFADAFSVSRETISRLKIYEQQLQLWQKTINLVAPSTLNQVWQRHFADSAQILSLAPPDPKTWVDLGSGAGFPGLVIAILLPLTSKTKVTLVESDSRKAAFLRETARLVAVPVDILPMRIEQAATRASVRDAGVVSARALAPLPRLFELAEPLFSAQTVGLFLKGREAGNEVQATDLEWNCSCELVPSLTDPDGRVAVVRNLHRRPTT